MKVTSKNTGEGTLVLEAIASTAEVSEAFNRAQIAFVQQMGLMPEPGKTPAQVASERLGIKDLDAVVQMQAAEQLVPLAIDKKGLIPAFPPKPEPTSPLKRGSTFSFKLTVTPKPEYELTSYEPIELTVQEWTFDEHEVDREIAQMAERFAEYVTAEPHPVGKGDHCLLALECTKDGERLAGLSTDGRTYTAGIGLMPDGFDEQIIGMNVGETKTFSFEGPGLDDEGNEITETIECTATVKELQKQVIPEVDDEWVRKYMPMYKSLADLRENISRSFEGQQRQNYEEYRRQLAAAELAKRFKGAIADEVYEAMSQTMMSNLRGQLQQQGITMEQFMEQQGGQQQFNMLMMVQTRQMLVQGYALDAVYRHEKLSITDKDFEEACRMINPQDPKMARQMMEAQGRGFVLREMAERAKASEWVLAHAKITTVKADGAADEATSEAPGEAADSE